MPEGATLLIILSLVFLAISAFFSSSEAAFLSLRKARIAHLASTGTPGAELVQSMTRQPERLLSTILLGNNLVNVAFTALVTVMVVSALGEGRGVLVATGVGTLALLILGETIPKTAAVHHAERVAFLYARLLKGLELLLFPLVIMLQWTSHRVNSLLGGGGLTNLSITEGELRAMIDIGEAEGAFEPAEAEMLENVFRFGDRQVREVMTPRTEMVYVERGATLRRFLETYAEHTHTRFPVHRESVDNIIGIISAKDVLRALAKHADYDAPVSHIIRDAYFVPETKRIAELFEELRQSGNQMAIAVDEFGGLAGLVTLKRLSEVVLGPVGEEGAGPEEEYEAIDQNTFQVDGAMSIDEANEELGLGLPEGDFETIAGYVLDVLGHIPAAGEHFEDGRLHIEVTKMQGLRIEAVKVTRLDAEGAQVEADTGPARRD